MQVVLVLDVQDRVPSESFVGRLPDSRTEPAVVRLSEFVDLELPITTPPDRAFPFLELGRGVDALVRKTRAAYSGRALDWFVVGKAPLPLFALLGFDLSAWARPMTILNQRKDGRWDLLRLDSNDPLGTSPLKLLLPEIPQIATGRVALVASTMSEEAPATAIRSYVTGRGEHLGGIAGVVGQVPLGADNAREIAQQLAEAFSSVPEVFPAVSESGCALFVAGPASLAFIAGRAMNPNILPPAWAPHFFRGNYVDALDVPSQEAAQVAIDQTDGAVTARLKLWGSIRSAYEQLQTELTTEDLASHPLVRDPAKLRDALTRLRFLEEPAGVSFRLRILEGVLELGHPFLAALLPLGEEAAVGVARQLLIHEVFHDVQNLTYANYVNIGRSDFALEEIDYWADCFAVEALARLATRATGAPLQEGVQTELDWVLRGIACFDRAEHGPRIHRLAERRLRRYLIWGLQRARADTLIENRDALTLLHERLVAVLSPLSGGLDPRGDKLVGRVHPDTELVVACAGCLARTRTGLDVDNIIELVRSMNVDGLIQALAPAVTNERRVLAPWGVAH